MPSFFDIEFEQKMSLDEYFVSIQSHERLKDIQLLFRVAENTIRLAMFSYGDESSLPIMRINPTKEFVAECMSGLIEISVGFIETCLSLERPPFGKIMDDESFSWVENGGLHRSIIFCWAISHEYFHGRRRHSDVLDLIDKPDIQHYQVTEFDADLCAIANVYRSIQRELSHLWPDIKIRQLILISVFWFIRGLNGNIGRPSTHLSVEERVYSLALKLAHLPLKEGEPPDQSFSNPETIANMESIFKIFGKSELAYKSSYPDVSGDVIGFVINFSENSKLISILKKWEEIKTKVSSVSGTNT